MRGHCLDVVAPPGSSRYTSYLGSIETQLSNGVYYLRSSQPGIPPVKLALVH
jgi:hypothetical protein